MNRPVSTGFRIIQERGQDVRFTVTSWSWYDEENAILHSYTDLVYKNKSDFVDNNYFGGLNPLYHPIPWKNPGTPRPAPPPELTPTEPAPPPPGFKPKWRLDPGKGIRFLPDYDPNYVYPSKSRWSGIEKGVMKFGQAVGEIIGAGSRVLEPLPFLMIDLPKEAWCPRCPPRGIQN